MAGNSNRASGSRPSLRVVVPHNFRSEHSNKMLEMTSNNNARARRTETTPISHSLPLVSWYHARFSGCYAPQEFPLALSNLIVDAESGLWAPLLIPIDGFTCHQSAGSPSESQSSTELHWWISKGDKQITKCMTNIIVSINFIAIVLILIASLFRQLFWQTHWKLRWNAHRLSLRPCCKFLKHFFLNFIWWFVFSFSFYTRWHQSDASGWDSTVPLLFVSLTVKTVSLYIHTPININLYCRWHGIESLPISGQTYFLKNLFSNSGNSFLMRGAAQESMNWDHQDQQVSPRDGVCHQVNETGKEIDNDVKLQRVIWFMIIFVGQ